MTRPRGAAGVEQLERVIAAQRLLACAPADPKAVFQLLADAACDVLGCDGTVASQPDGPDAFVLRAAAGQIEGHVGMRYPSAGTLTQLAVTTRTGQVCSDWSTDPRVSSSVTAPVSFLIVPLLREGEVIATIGAHSTSKGFFTEEHVALLGMLADVGAQRLGHALTRESHNALQQQSSLVLSAMSEALIVHDADANVVFANPAAERLFARPVADLLNMNTKDSAVRTLREDGRVWPAQERPTPEVLRSGVPARGVVIGLERVDGAVVWMDLNCEPIVDAGGSITGAVSTYTDITARVEADRELRSAKQRLETATEVARLASWEYDLVHFHRRFSAELLDLFGHVTDADGGPYDPWLSDQISLEDKELLRTTRERCVTSGAPADVVIQITHADGSPRFLWTRMQVETDHDGTALRLLGTTQDVTEREIVMRRLLASEQNFRTAFESAPIGMAMIGLDPGEEGQYLHANQAFCDMLGYRTEEIPGLRMEDLTYAESLEADRARFAQIVNGEITSVAFEKRYRRKDGSPLYAWLTSAVAWDGASGRRFTISQAVDTTARREQQAELERLALTDTLTGLANRTLLTDRLDQALARLHRTGQYCALLLLDIDRFKLVNDSLGHQVGDALLVEVAHRLQSVSRADTTVARLGGDEFVVLVEGLDDPEEIHPVAARLLSVLREPYLLEGALDAIVSSVSIGVSVGDSTERTHADMYREADLALYRAKDTGRDKYALFDAALRNRVVERIQSENLLRRALAEDLVVPFFQPLVELRNNKIHSVEALARLDVPGRGIVAPIEFIEVAEESGLIVELDLRMFELALRQFNRWDVGIDVIGTNFSARSLSDPDFVDRVATIMTRSGVSGSAIRVEITESSLLSPSPTVLASLRRMAALGIVIGLDDFGTGYSALSYLQQYDLSFLKIDRSFVQRLGTPRDDAIVAAMIDLAHAHSMRVIAEGIETEKQLAAVSRMGCERAQGFLIARPMPGDELAAVAAAYNRAAGHLSAADDRREALTT